MRAFAMYHPLVLLLYFLGALLITMLTVNPVMLVFSLIGALLLAVMLESKKAVLVSMGFYLPMFLLLAVTNPLFSHNGMTPLFFLNDNPVTLEAILYGAALAGMIVSVLYWCRCYTKVMTSDKFIYLFGKAIPKLSLIISMALRFVPLFTRQIRKIHRIQKTMGLYATNSLVDRLLGSFRVFSAIITWSLENAVETAAAMQARGYGLPGRTHFSLFRFTVRDGVMLFILILLSGYTLGSLLKGTVDFAFYPRLTELSLSGPALACYGGTLLFMLLPFLIEVKENLLWSYFRSRT